MIRKISAHYIDYIPLSYRFDVLAEQMTDELPEVEAPNGTIARGKGRVIRFHAALAALTALFGMANQGFNASATIHQAAVGLRVTRRQRARIEPRLLQTAFLQPFQRL